MKTKIFTLIISLSAISASIVAQDDPQLLLNKLESHDTTQFVPQMKQDTTGPSTNIASVSSKSDTTKIKFGKKVLTVIDKGNNTSVEITNIDKNNAGNVDWDNEFWNRRHKKRFEPHWAGVELGVNGLLSSSKSTSLKGDAAIMDLNSGKSINFNLNFMEYAIPFAHQHMGIVTGMGMEVNNFRLSNNISLMKNDAGVTVADSSYINNGVNLTKSKLTMTYLTIPLLMEFQVPSGHSRFYISGGVIGGVKLGSHTKVVYQAGGQKQKDKNRDDYNLATLRYGFHARIGYRFINLYATYYPVALFEKDKGPEVYPFNIGLVLLGF